jgi:hypothetical protein
VPQLADHGQHVLLVVEPLQRRHEVLAARLAPSVEHALRVDQERPEARQQPVGGNGLPVRFLGTLDEPVNHLAAALHGNVGAVALLLRLVITHAEIKQVPGQFERRRRVRR